MSEKQKDNKFFLGKHHSEESKKKMAKIKLGNTWNKGKVRSEEYKKKMSEAKKGSVPWNKGKTQSNDAKRKMSVAKKGMKWFNNGEISVVRHECPVGFKPGRLIKTNTVK